MFSTRRKVYAFSKEYQQCFNFLLLYYRLTITGDQQSSIKKQALASVKSDYEKKMIDAVEEMRRKEKDNYNQIMAAEKKRLETEKAKYTEKIKAKLDETQEVTQQIQNVS